ncbi:OLC1v1000153C1 [Oldenlandia corymbosa var. corymbosa]|uniref:OLC1v1000153C1 n=1 Tax=Oldenlandia corymbosa var. corymbosa TaxID=529605 RepID=A0AAV1D2N6_OLDCO|nr:OLC1v1000153C1 [Oldenlandia corymbosa var. corymbosa]
MDGTSDANPMAYDKAKAGTHGVKPEDIDFLQPYEEYVMLSFNRSSRHFTLGPNFPPASESLKEYVPMLSPDDAYHKYGNHCKFDNFDRIRVWPWSDKPEIQDAFVQWYQELEPEYGDTWRMAGIYDLLQFCTIGLGESWDLVEAVLVFWSDTSNVFCFPWGLMTPTLLDVCVITSLSVIATVAMDGDVTDDDAAAAAAAAAGQPRSYGPFINENKGKLSRLHYIRFLALWLNRYVFPGKSFQMTMNWYHVAGRLAAGEQMNLVQAALAMLYHCLHKATPGFTEWWGELSTTMYGSGYEAIKTAFWIGKYVKPKVATGKNKDVGKAKAGGQKTKKSVTVAGGKAKSNSAKRAPTTTRRIRVTGNSVTVHGSDEELDSQESEKGSVALGESAATRRIESESGGTKSKKNLRVATSSTQPSSVKKAPPSIAALMARLERTKAASFIKVGVASNSPNIPLGVALQQIAEMFQLPAEEVYNTKYDQLKNLLSTIQTFLVDDSMVAAIRLILVETTQKQIEYTDVGLGEYESMTETMKKLHPKYQDAQQVVKGAQASWNFLKNTITRLMQTVGTAPNSPAAMDQVHPNQPVVIPNVGGGVAPEEA